MDFTSASYNNIAISKYNKQLLDEVEHDIMNYQNGGLCYLPKPKAEADNTHEVLIIHDIMRKPNSIIVLLYIYTFTHFLSEENTPRGLVTSQTLNLT